MTILVKVTANMNKALRLLTAKRIRPTQARLHILSALESSDQGSMSADQIYKKLLAAEKTVGLATVYRLLKQMEFEGIVERAWAQEGGEVRFVFHLHGQNPAGDKPELRCVGCQRSMPLELPTLREQLNRLGQDKELMPQGRPISIQILCKRCENAA